MITSILNDGAKLAAGWTFEAAPRSSNFLTNSRTSARPSAPSSAPTIPTTNSTTIPTTTQTNCVSASRAHDKSRRAFALWHETSTASKPARLKSLPPRLVLRWVQSSGLARWGSQLGQKGRARRPRFGQNGPQPAFILPLNELRLQLTFPNSHIHLEIARSWPSR